MDNPDFPELLKVAPENHRAWNARDMVILIIFINYLFQINIILSISRVYSVLIIFGRIPLH